MARIPVSVLIPTKNNETTIGTCLRSLSRQTFPDFEVLVFNDASSDRTLEVAESVAKEDLRIRVLTVSESRGIAVARNALLGKAAGKIVVFLDGDASCPESWLEKLVRPFEDPEVGCTGGPDRIPPDHSLLSRCIDYSMHSFIGSGKMRMSGNPLVRYLPAGCNMAVRREVLDGIGRFDESFVIRGEEKELANRIRMAGFRIVHVEEAWVWHSRRPTLSAFWRQTYLSGKVRVDILRAAPRVFEWPHFFPAFCVALWLILALSSLFSTKMLSLWIGVTVLYGCLLLVDGILGARKMGSTGAFFIIPVTSAIVPLAYGTGTLARFLEKR
ncbi:MAG TPA: glycosyltransferase [Syntrophales bacterium]|nr:glycosyltransferase [Syntrophales bacterium]HQB29225.1 glycosyltransferase [Syntrophales bacterium]HQN77450.1 glycosyltransferase [Syntrophales bacterium]HQQ27660.1 glycosyltransferase [Syntrophales bacterium]